MLLPGISGAPAVRTIARSASKRVCTSGRGVKRSLNRALSGTITNRLYSLFDDSSGGLSVTKHNRLKGKTEAPLVLDICQRPAACCLTKFEYCSTPVHAASVGTLPVNNATVTQADAGASTE